MNTFLMHAFLSLINALMIKMAKIFSWVNFSQVIFGHFCQSIIILALAVSGFDWLSCISGAHASECLIFDVDPPC